MKNFFCLFLTVLIVACSSEDGVDSNNNYIQNTDTTAPIITIVGDTLINVSRGSTYIDEGATATDDVDGDITSNIYSNASLVNTRVAGEYIIIYRVYDSSGNYSSATRTVNVIDNGHPIVGDLTNGGVVFWVDSIDNTKGLVASIHVIPAMTWWNEDCEGEYCGPYSISGGTAIGTGEDNTNKIIDLLSYGGGTNYAAYYAKNYDGGGFDDWFLPSRGEVEAFAENWDLIKNIVEDSNIVFAGEWILRIQNSFIWTSSGVITPCLCDAFASYGYQVFSRHENKGNLYRILPVRAY